MYFDFGILKWIIGGIPELLDDNRGLLFDPHKPETLFHAISQAVQFSLEEYHALSEKIRGFAQTLSYDHYYRKLCQVVPELGAMKEAMNS